MSKYLLSKFAGFCFSILGLLTCCDANTVVPALQGPDALALSRRSLAQQLGISLDSTAFATQEIANYGNYSDLFEPHSFPIHSYVSYEGLDVTSLFSSSFALDDRFIVVGANGYDIFRGIVHVFVSTGYTTWSLHSLIKSPAGPNANFGVSVDLHGSNIVIGANAYLGYVGRAFIFSLHLDQHWVLNATFRSPLSGSTGFGRSVAIWGSVAVVGTAGNGAFIYELADQKWSLTHALRSPISGDIYFGRKVDVFENFVVVSAPGWQDTYGAVFVYSRAGPTAPWTLLNTLLSPASGLRFGTSISVRGNTLAVGAPGHLVNASYCPKCTGDELHTRGSVFVYELDEDFGFQLQWSTESPLGDGSNFGSDVDLSDSQLVVGAMGFPASSYTGAAVLYQRQAVNNYTAAAFYPSPAGDNGYFGATVRIGNRYAGLAGAFGHDALRGAIFLAERAPTAAPIVTPGDQNGNQQSLSGGSARRRRKISDNLLLVIIVVTLVVVLGGAAAATIDWKACCCPAPLGLKKKKKEEENSPYTVHSYVGYSESDDGSSVQSRSTVPYPSAIPYPVQPDMRKDDDLMLKKKLAYYGSSLSNGGDGSGISEEFITSVDEASLRRMFPYKVYSFRGYHEDKAREEGFDPDQLADEKIKAEDTKSNAPATEEDETKLNTLVNANSQSWYSNDGSMRSINSFWAENYVHEEPQDPVVNGGKFSSGREYRDSQSLREEIQQRVVQVSQFQQQMRQRSVLFCSEVSESDQGNESVSGSSHSLSLVDAAKQRYTMIQEKRKAALRSKTKSMVSQDSDLSVSSSSDTTPSGGSYLDAAKAQYQEVKARASPNVKDTGSADSSSSPLRGLYVEAAKAQGELVKARISPKANESGSINSEVSPRSATSESVVSRAKAQYEAYQAMRKQAAAATLEAPEAKAKEEKAEDQDDLTVSSLSTTTTSRKSLDDQELPPPPSTTTSLFSLVKERLLGVTSERTTRRTVHIGSYLSSRAGNVDVTEVDTRPNRPGFATNALPTLKEMTLRGFDEPQLDEEDASVETVRLDQTIGNEQRPMLSLSLPSLKAMEWKSLEEVELMEIKERALPVVLTDIVETDVPPVLTTETKEVSEGTSVTKVMSAIDETTRRQLAAQQEAMEEELRQLEERNRLKEEARLRALETAKARFAMFKDKAQQSSSMKSSGQTDASLKAVVEEAKMTLHSAQQTRRTSKGDVVADWDRVEAALGEETVVTMTMETRRLMTQQTTQRQVVTSAAVSTQRQVAGEGMAIEQMTTTTTAAATVAKEETTRTLSSSSSSSSSFTAVHTSPYSSPRKQLRVESPLPEP